MALLRELVIILLFALMVCIDILLFLSFFRLISYRWHFRWLKALNSKAKPVVDWFTRHVERAVRYFTGKILQEKITLFIGTLVLLFVRFTLAVLFGT